MKKTLAIFFILGVSFLFGNKVSAFTEETYQMLTSNLNVTSSPGSFHSQRYRFTNTGLVTQVSIEVNSIRFASTTTSTQQVMLMNSVGTVLAYYNFESTSTINGKYFINYGGSYSVTAGTNYWLTNTGGGNLMAKTPSTTYTNAGNWDKSCIGGGSINCSIVTENNHDYYYGFNLGLEPGTGVSVSFTDTPDTVCDFNNWEVQNTIPGDQLIDAPYWQMGVMYGPALDQQAYLDRVTLLPNTVTQFTKFTDFSAGQIWYATPVLLTREIEFPYYDPVVDTFFREDVENYNVTIGATWVFGILPDGSCTSTNPYYSPGSSLAWPTGTSTITATCDETDGGFFNNSICKVLQYLFNPASSPNYPHLQSSWQGLKDQVSQKPPFGYFEIYSNTLAQFATVSSTTSTLSEVVSTTLAQDLSDLGFFASMRDFIGYLFWILGLFYIYHRFKNFSLHG